MGSFCHSVGRRPICGLLVQEDQGVSGVAECARSSRDL